MLETKNLSKVYYSGFFRRIPLEAVKNVSIKVDRGKIISLVGESGSGKTTLARIILRLLPPTSGKILFENKEVWSLKNLKELKWYWKNVHGIFQDPYASYNPIYKVSRILNQAFNLLEEGSSDRNSLINQALKQVGLDPKDVLGKYPHELSGGQRQRLMIARCLILRPKLIIADEPISMLDASTRAGILKLLKEMCGEYKSSMIFITHDMGLAYYISDKILVMYRGEVVEEGGPEEVIGAPQHPYTQNLVKSVPLLYKKWEDL